MKQFVLFCAMLFGGLGVLPAQAQQAFPLPGRTLHIVAGFPPGSTSHTLAMFLAEKLKVRLKMPVVVEFRAGGRGVPLLTMLRTAAPDGYTIALLSGTHAAAMSLDTNFPFDLRKDFEPVVRFAQFPNLIATGKQKPGGGFLFDTLQDLVRQAKAKPGALTVGTMAVGTPDFLTAYLMQVNGGLRFVIAPYGSNPQQMVPEALSGQVDAIIQNYAAFKGMLDEGKLKALAVTTAHRSPHFPDLPTVIESGIPGIDTKSWQGLYAPLGTPQAVVRYLNQEIRAVMEDPELKAKVGTLGAEFWPSTPEELRRTMAEDIDVQAEVIKKAGAPR